MKVPVSYQTKPQSEPDIEQSDCVVLGFQSPLLQIAPASCRENEPPLADSSGCARGRVESSLRLSWLAFEAQ